VIGVSIPAADHGWTGGVVYWAEEARKMYGDEADIRIQTAGTPQEQISQIENMLTQGVHAMVVLATESAPLTPTARKIKERGVYLVNVDRGFLEPVADVYVAGDNAAFGRESAKYVAEKMGGKGNLVILTGIPSTVDTARVEAAMEVFKGYPDIKILDRAVGQWNREKALNAMQGLLQKHPQIDAVWAQDDDMAEGAEQAIREAGRQAEMWLFGGAGKKDIVKRVMDGDPMYPADMTYPPSMILAGIAIAKAQLVDKDLSAAAEDMPEHLGVTKEMLDAAKAQEGQKQVTLPVILITPENAGKFYFPESVF
jgi:ribose transport system substrate-binding protein